MILSKNYHLGGENMDNLSSLGSFFVGLGVFFIGIGVLWGVSIWEKQKKKK
jgi:hypothetical protein